MPEARLAKEVCQPRGGNQVLCDGQQALEPSCAGVFRLLNCFISATSTVTTASLAAYHYGWCCCSTRPANNDTPKKGRDELCIDLPFNLKAPCKAPKPWGRISSGGSTLQTWSAASTLQESVFRELHRAALLLHLSMIQRGFELRTHISAHWEH